MYKFKRKAGISIPREYENEIWLENIKRFLSRPSLVYGSEDEIEIQKFYLKTEKNIIIPRFFPIQDYVNCEIIDERMEGKLIDIEHNIKPKNNLQKETIKYLENNDDGIIELQPGTGKTVITIYDVCERKRKPFILLYLHNLAIQWRDRFIEHSSLENDNILIVNSSNFKEMKNYDCLIITNQTFISLLKRKPIEFLTEIYKSNIGIFISDECHTSTGAKTFSECSLNIPCKVVRGLSATPYRSDGNYDIIEYHLGSIYSNESYEGTNTNVEVTFILLDYGIDQPRRYKYLYWNNKFNRARYLTLMCNPKHCPRFHSVLKGLLNKFKNVYDMLVILERNKLLDLMYDWIDYDSKSKFNRSEGLDKLEYKMTFSTPGKIRDGVDAPWKELILLTSPVANIKQMTGRICREYKGKDKVKIIDIVDIGSPEIKKYVSNRRNFYSNNNWKIKYIGMDLNLNPKEFTEDKALTLINS